MIVSGLVAASLALQVLVMPKNNFPDSVDALVAMTALRGIVHGLNEWEVDHHETVREFAAKQFSSLGAKSLPVVLAMMSHKDAAVREDAAQLLGEYTLSKDPDVTLVALNDEQAAQAVAALIGAMDDSNHDVAKRACSSLTDYGRDLPDAVKALRKQLSKADDGLAYEASHSVRLIGLAAKSAAPELAGLARRFVSKPSHETWCYYVLLAMREVGADGPEDLALYAEMAASPSKEIAGVAKAALKAHGKPQP